MDDIITLDQLEAHLRREVVAAGGAKKWNSKNRAALGHVLHMIANGSAASLVTVQEILGYRKIIRYERVIPSQNQTGAKS